MLRRLLRNSDPAEGSPNPTPEPSGDPAKGLDKPLEGKGLADPPPAAKIVLEGTKTERELSLEKTVKDREQRISELEDENRRLKTPPPEIEPEKKHWLDDYLP